MRIRGEGGVPRLVPVLAERERGHARGPRGAGAGGISERCCG
jgi:hypothetical protein